MGVVGIDEFVVAGRHVGQDTEPAEGIDALVFLADGGGDRAAADAVVAVAAGDDVAVQVVRLVGVGVADAGVGAVDVVQGNVLGFEQHALAGEDSLDQVFGHLGLAIDRDVLAFGQASQVDAERLAVQADAEAGVGQAFLAQAMGDAGAVQQRDRALFQHAGADAAFDVGAGAAFQHQALDAGDVQKLRQQQPGRAGADDDDREAGADGHAISWRFCVRLTARRRERQG